MGEADAREELKNALQREISLMREILSNLHEEELALLSRDLKGWDRVMANRSDMVAELHLLRIKRLEATAVLQGKAPETKPLSEIPLDQLIPLEDESSCELFTLLDQLIALMDRLNLQNCRNDQLFDQTKQIKELPLYCSYPHPNFQPSTARRRSRVTTDTRKNQK